MRLQTVNKRHSMKFRSLYPLVIGSPSVYCVQVISDTKIPQVLWRLPGNDVLEYETHLKQAGYQMTVINGVRVYISPFWKN